MTNTNYYSACVSQAVDQNLVCVGVCGVCGVVFSNTPDYCSNLLQYSLGHVLLENVYCNMDLSLVLYEM